MAKSQYLSEVQISAEIGSVQLGSVVTVSQDTYNEQELLKSLKKSNMVGELLACTIQIAVVGFGGKSYGTVIYKGIELDVKSTFIKCHVNLVSELNKKLHDDELTPRRLIRLFRFHIQKYIKDTGKRSYLARKYYTGEDKYIEYVFPGSESIVTDKAHAQALLAAYHVLDERNNTNICERIKRVLNARLVSY